MIKSMTGFGRAEAGRLTIEVRSLNSKQFDLGVRLPASFRSVEHEVRARAAKAIERGKVEVTIWLSNDGTTAAKINTQLFGAYYRQLKSLFSVSPLSLAWGLQRPLLAGAILRLPDVVSAGRDEVAESDAEALLPALDEALERLDEFRTQEGARLREELLGRVANIRRLLASVEPYEKPRVEAVRTRIRETVREMNIPVDSNRLEQEMIFYVEKLDITEEKVRLESHCRYFIEVADNEPSAGRKLGFIAQEMGREINTLGSKAGDVQIQRIVVEMKDELEKIKEQVLNIL